MIMGHFANKIETLTPYQMALIQKRLLTGTICAQACRTLQFVADRRTCGISPSNAQRQGHHAQRLGRICHAGWSMGAHGFQNSFNDCTSEADQVNKG